MSFASRETVAGAYGLDDRGRVTSPGKFEGEPWYVVSLWDLVLEGLHDTEIGDSALFLLSHDLTWAVDDYPPGASHIAVWEDPNGFVHHGFRNLYD